MTFLTTKARYSKMLEINETIVFSEHLFLFPTNNKFTLSSGLFTIAELTEMINNVPYRIGFSSKEEMQKFIRYISRAGGHITEVE